MWRLLIGYIINYLKPTLNNRRLAQNLKFVPTLTCLNVKDHYDRKTFKHTLQCIDEVYYWKGLRKEYGLPSNLLSTISVNIFCD